MTASNPGKSSGNNGWLVVAGLAIAAYFAFRHYNPEPDPRPHFDPLAPIVATPSISGRWVATDGSEILELSPLGEATVTTRGETNPLQGRYQYANGKLQMTLNMWQGERKVENTVSSLGATEMTIFLPKLIGLREARYQVYWRIDRMNDSPERARLIGKWSATDGSGNTIQCGADDTYVRSSNGKADYGIYRVVNGVLEYHVTTQQAAAARFPIVSVTDAELVLHSNEYNINVRYVRAGP